MIYNKHNIMKKIITMLIILISISCNTTAVPVIVEEIPVVPKNVEIILTTTTPKFDEIVVSYKDFDIEEEWVYGPKRFTYDINGNPEPMIFEFPNYKYKEIVGNAYRNNDQPYSLKAQIFIEGELVLEKESIGSEGVYASVNFDYTIKN
jgi:hypothetical protein